MRRRTKIVATLGPVSRSPEVIRSLMLAGANVFRLNMSHADQATHLETAHNIRAIAQDLQLTVGLLIDLQGPKIRIGKFIAGKIKLTLGQQFTLDFSGKNAQGDEHYVAVDYLELIDDLRVGDQLVLDDGRVVVLVTAIEHKQVITKVLLGEHLSDNKGLNKKGGGLSAKALTLKDIDDISFAAKVNADFVAVSFPRSADDINLARDLLKKVNSMALIVAKIERAEAIEVIDEIILAADVIMVARGDLGVEIGLVEVPAIQKKLIKRVRELDKAVITATQMMESMICNPVPTRAEVSDVANAVLDGTDAVMLSAETASGEYPVAVVEMMSDICVASERQQDLPILPYVAQENFTRIDESIAMAAMYIAKHLKITAIIAFTQTGNTPLWMSRISSDIPILGITDNQLALGRMTLYRGVYPFFVELAGQSFESITIQLLAQFKSNGTLKHGDTVILTSGDHFVQKGIVNNLKILQV
jgi:pyruvate kinase